jgi:hypothetical protein
LAYVPPGAIATDGSSGRCNSYIPSTTVLDRFLWVVNVLARNSFVIVIGEGCWHSGSRGSASVPNAVSCSASKGTQICRPSAMHLAPMCRPSADNHLNTDDTFITNPTQWNTVRHAVLLALQTPHHELMLAC